MPTEVTLSQSLVPFRQGTEVRTPREFFASSMTPRMGSSSPFLYVASGSKYSATVFNDEVAGMGPSRLGGKNTVTILNYDLEKLNYGQPIEFLEDTPFEEVDSEYLLSGSGPAFLGAIDSFYKGSRYPEILFNKTLRNPAQMDGVIEPLTIRREIEFSAPEGAHVFHTIRASLIGNFDETFRGSMPIMQQVAFSPHRIEPYLDAPEAFGSSSQGLLPLPGLVMEAKSSAVGPFVDISIEQWRVRGLLTGSVTSSIRHPLSIMSSSTDSMFIDGYRSSGAGFTYTNQNKYGTDSVAYGGLKK